MSPTFPVLTDLAALTRDTKVSRDSLDFACIIYDCLLVQSTMKEYINHIMQFEIRMTRFHLWIPEVLCKLVTHSLIKMQTYSAHV